VDERAFLYSLCTEALEMEDSIKFAAVINQEGKLIVAKPLRCTNQQNETMDNHIFKSKPINSYIKKENMIHPNLFYKSGFQLIYINKNIFIALTPLTEEQDKYLCIYFESSISFV
jgi:hypothetical protein